MGIEKPRPTFHPTFLFKSEDGSIQPVCDSSPIIRRLESMYPGRSVLPTDPALAFIDYLIEDFADEWCTKYMFHYRWYPAEDADNAGTLLPLGMDVSLPADLHQTFKKIFTERQVGRLYVVGSNDTTAPVIDASYRRYLAAMEAHLAQQPFMLGKRPGAGDFAMYGQLTQLVGFRPNSPRHRPRGITAHRRLGGPHGRPVRTGTAGQRLEPGWRTSRRLSKACSMKLAGSMCRRCWPTPNQ